MRVLVLVQSLDGIFLAFSSAWCELEELRSYVTSLARLHDLRPAHSRSKDKKASSCCSPFIFVRVLLSLLPGVSGDLRSPLHTDPQTVWNSFISPHCSALPVASLPPPGGGESGLGCNSQNWVLGECTYCLWK